MGLRITVLAQGRPDYLESMLALAHAAGVQVHHAGSGHAHAANPAGERCDAVLWDVAAADELPQDWPRRAAAFGRVPLLVLSHAGLDTVQVERLLRAGVDDVLWLSELDPGRLVAALRKAVARGRARTRRTGRVRGRSPLPDLRSGARIRGATPEAAPQRPTEPEAGTSLAAPTAALGWASAERVDSVAAVASMPEAAAPAA